mmetsp:Transcript_5488/g.4674  ORF Transcript_5488/g.4674 Transcript_5488/m.4674 type:complete len:141 (+) Transcript_5488:1107-1529(+)
MWSQIEIAMSTKPRPDYIFKLLSKKMIGSEITGIHSHLEDFLHFVQSPPKIRFHRNIESLLDIIKASLLFQVKETGNLLKRQSNYTLDEKWNKIYYLEINKTAKLNAAYLTAKIFYDQLNELRISDGLYFSLLRLCKIYC